MKRLSLLLGLFFTVIGVSNAQVKIGENPQSLNNASLLELESNSRVLVLTRVSQTQMAAITPLQGALVYNTDEGCIFQYDGTQWVNLCQAFNVSFVDNGDGTFTFSNGMGPITFDGTGVSNFEINGQGELVLTKSDGTSFTVPLQTQITGSFTADAIVNDSPTIAITDTGTALNFEVSEITGENIADGTVNGFLDIQFKSITDNQMAAESIGTPELKPTSVTDAKIDFSSVTLGDFLNDPGFITATDVVSTDPGNSITDSGGAFYDDSGLLTDIDLNEIAINDNFTLIDDHLMNDGDLSSTNEVNTVFEVIGTNLVLTDPNATFLVPLADLGSDDQDLLTATLDGSSQLTITIEDGTGVTANLSDLEESAEVAQNATDIADNATEIATNTADITSNANDITTLQGTVATNTANISANAASITTLQGTVATNTGNIATNATNIAANGGAITTLQTNVTTNSTLITANSTAIGTNTTNITANTANIGTNTANIATNTTNIAANTAAIAADTDGDPANEINTGFQVNGGNLEITDSGGTLTVPLNSIGSDDQNLGTATLDASSQLTIAIENGTATTADLSALEESADIAANATDIADNATEIATNTADITANANDITTLQGNVAGNTTNIATNTASITTLQGTVTTNTGNIATNTTNITTNATAITTLQTNVTTNSTLITANTTAINNHIANDADIDNANEIQALSLSGRTLGTSLNGTTVNVNSLNSIRSDATATVQIADADYTVILSAGVTNVTLPNAGNGPGFDALENGRIIILKNTSGGAVTASENFIDPTGATTTAVGVGITWLQYDLTNTVWHQIN